MPLVARSSSLSLMLWGEFHGFVPESIVRGLADVLRGGRRMVHADAAAAPAWLREHGARVGCDLHEGRVVAVLPGGVVGLQLRLGHAPDRGHRELVRPGADGVAAAALGLLPHGGGAARNAAPAVLGADAVGHGRRRREGPGRRRRRRARNLERAFVAAAAPADHGVQAPEAEPELSPDNKRLQSLYRALLRKQNQIENLVRQLEVIEAEARAAGQVPGRAAIRPIHDSALVLLDGYERVERDVNDLKAFIAQEGETPIAPPLGVDRHPRKLLPASVTCRLPSEPR